MSTRKVTAKANRVQTIKIQILSKPGCHLCEDMKDIVAPIAKRRGCELQETDITTDPELEKEYGEQIPVLFVNGRKAFKYQVTAAELVRRLDRENS